MTIALLPDRESVTAKAWLAQQPQIEVVARDRGREYALGAAQALPQANQVADRRHLMENASHAFLHAVRKSMRQVGMAIGTATINPKLLTAAERLQYQGYLQREETNAVIRGVRRRWCLHQRNRAPNRAQPKAGPQWRSWSADRHLPRPANLPGAASALV
nr:ISL3 family transposase [Rhizobium sp. P007]